MKKTIALIIALTLALSLFAIPASAQAAEGELVKITMLQRLNASYVVEDNPVIEAWGQMLGFEIEIEAPPISNYNDRRNIIMASGDLPDIIYVGDTAALYTQWAEQGLLLDLTPYFVPETMPNATSVLTEDELAVVRVASLDGNIFSLPRVQTKPWDNMIYRADWLENLGLEVPQTPAEFAEVALAFTTQDPDGNGQNDTFGWSLNTEMGPEHRSILSGFGVRPTEVPDENGEYVPMQAQDAYMDYLNWCREMYAAGSLDPEFYITKMYEDDDLFFAGKFGMLYCNKVTEHIPAYMSKPEFVNANPGAKLVAGPALMQEGQTAADIYYGPQVWGNFAINADSAIIDDAIRFLDAGYTDEVNELLMIGLEGITYETFDSETRFATKTAEQAANAEKYVASYATINYQRQDKGLLIANGNNEEEMAAFNEAYNAIGELTNRVSYQPVGTIPGYGKWEESYINSGVRDEWRELRTNYVCGNVTQDEVDDFIQSKFIPAHQELLDLCAEYNGVGINK